MKDCNGKTCRPGNIAKVGNNIGEVKFDEFEGYYIVTPSNYKRRLANHRFEIIKK